MTSFPGAPPLYDEASSFGASKIVARLFTKNAGDAMTSCDCQIGQVALIDLVDGVRQSQEGDSWPETIIDHELMTSTRHVESSLSLDGQ